MELHLKDKVVVITGGGGLLGSKHAEAIAEEGGVPIIVDIDEAKAKQTAKGLKKCFNVHAKSYKVDITIEEDIRNLLQELQAEFGIVYGLINNAANNPKMMGPDQVSGSRLEDFSLVQWNDDIAVGLTGAMICSRVFGGHMAKQGKGVILNVASDLGIIAPDQRIYQKEGLANDQQPVKPVTYSVVKHGLIGLTKYLATYWADKGVRVDLGYVLGGAWGEGSQDGAGAGTIPTMETGRTSYTQMC